MPNGKPAARRSSDPSPPQHRPQAKAVSQRRCFKCGKKGHIAKSCRLQRKGSSKLADLPAELLELICGFLVGINDWAPFVFFMLDFRLTCRKINNKTYDFFGKIAFRYLSVTLNSRRLGTLTAMSQCPHFAVNTERIVITTHDQVLGDGEYDDVQKQLRNGNLSPRGRRRAEEQLREAYAEQDDKSFVERSGTDGVMLRIVFSRLPNLREVIVSSVDQRSDRIPLRRKLGSHEPSTTRAFAVTVASLAHAQVRPHLLRLSHAGTFSEYEAISIGGLSMPSSVLDCLSDLRSLILWLQTKGPGFRSKSLASHQLSELYNMKSDRRA